MLGVVLTHVALSFPLTTGRKQRNFLAGHDPPKLSLARCTVDNASRQMMMNVPTDDGKDCRWVGAIVSSFDRNRSRSRRGDSPPPTTTTTTTTKCGPRSRSSSSSSSSTSSSSAPPISNPRSSFEERSEPSERTNTTTNRMSDQQQQQQQQQLSSPSSSVTGTGSFRSPSSRGSLGNVKEIVNGNANDEPRLVVQQQPLPYVYSNESFEVTLQLEASKAILSSLDGPEIELVASLHHATSGRECGSEALLVTQPSRIVLTLDGSNFRCSVKCMVRMDSIPRDEGASLAVRFRPRPDSRHGTIAGVSTNATNIVNYKIRITLEDDWGPVWYKDEGGRDKSMEIYAAIYDKEGQLRTGEQIPLHSSLCYDSPGTMPIKVANQEILRTLGASKIVIDKDTGRARIRFRVEDVSKNHQAQDFVIMVAADPTVKGFRDVAPDFTPPVNVRSKRNKRSRPTTSSTGTHIRTNSSEASRRMSPATPRQRYDHEPPLHDFSRFFDTGDVPRLRDALKSVIHWADEVVNGLYPLQWQVLGYAQHPDGSTDYARPYHNMPNPNPCIDHVLGMYSETVRESFRILLHFVEQVSPAQSDDPASVMPMPLPAPLPRQFGEDPMYGIMRPPPLPPPQQPPQMQGYPGMSPQPMSRRVMSGGLEAFHGIEQPPLLYPPPRGGGGGSSLHPPMMHQHQQPHPPMHHYMRSPPREGDMMAMHGMPPRNVPPLGDVPMQRSSLLLRPEEESRESEVEYVLAKQYKALRTGERLGFPAYSGNKEILGFYRDHATAGSARQFSPISRHRNDFGPLEILQASEILEDAIKKKSDAVHSLKEWGTIDNLLNQALVYDWRQDIGTDS